MRKLMHRREIVAMKKQAESDFGCTAIRFNSCPWWRWRERRALQLVAARYEAVVSTLCQVLNGHVKPPA